MYLGPHIFSIVQGINKNECLHVCSYFLICSHDYLKNLIKYLCMIGFLFYMCVLFFWVRRNCSLYLILYYILIYVCAHALCLSPTCCSPICLQHCQQKSVWTTETDLFRQPPIVTDLDAGEPTVPSAHTLEWWKRCPADWHTVRQSRLMAWKSESCWPHMLSHFLRIHHPVWTCAELVISLIST